MFKIFKKQKIAVIGESGIGKTLAISNKYSKEVLEIHNEFEIAADKLLAEANSIIQEASSKNANKVSRLQSLGFSRVKEVEEIVPLLKKAELSKEQVELVNYYKREYPFNKFITEEQVKEICHKYNLVCGNVDRFTGFVPEKNLKEIESFKLKEKDKGLICITNNEIFILKNAEIRSSGEYAHIYNINEIDPFKYAFQSNDSNRGRMKKKGVDFYSNDSKNIFGLAHKGFINFTVDNSLKICAPVKDMDIRDLELTEGYKLEKKFIPDPVVLQPVDGGYLVLTKWGPEASDPILLNEIDN